jgi:transcriptional regulator with XRE-family HTH domain
MGCGFNTDSVGSGGLLSLIQAKLVFGFAHAVEERAMIIGDRLRALGEEKKLSQSEIEKRTGLLRCYISRVENGHSVPAFEPLENFARALEVPMYELFYKGEEPPNSLCPPTRKADSKLFGASGKDGRMLAKFHNFLGQTDSKNTSILLLMAQKVARRKPERTISGLIRSVTQSCGRTINEGHRAH